jgi:hypothetical protein
VLAFISIAASPTLWVMTRYGIGWRQRRLKKEKERVEEKRGRN